MPIIAKKEPKADCLAFLHSKQLFLLIGTKYSTYEDKKNANFYIQFYIKDKNQIVAWCFGINLDQKCFWHSNNFCRKSGLSNKQAKNDFNADIHYPLLGFLIW